MDQLYHPKHKPNMYNINMYIAILGRQPNIGVAELERVFGSTNVNILSDSVASVTSDNFDIDSLGGIPKAGKVVMTLPYVDWHRVAQTVATTYAKQWSTFSGKITTGVSVYGFRANSREVQRVGIDIKNQLKKTGVSLRLIPNQAPQLSSATSHHNKLGLNINKVEILIVRTDDDKTIVAESVGTQNISAYAARDQKRPKRDAFVGMLPPKLAQIMVNLAVGQEPNHQQLTVLDPFCGTGVILQEAVLKGYNVYGTDLSDKMIDYSHENLVWLKNKYKLSPITRLEVGDAMAYQWQTPVDVVVCETYLGQPFSAPPSAKKLAEVSRNCEHIITEFLRNIGSQIKPGTTLCVAVPAWRDNNGQFTHLSLSGHLNKLGYSRVKLRNVTTNKLLYYRNDQVVARELLILEKS